MWGGECCLGAHTPGRAQLAKRSFVGGWVSGMQMSARRVLDVGEQPLRPQDLSF